MKLKSISFENYKAFKEKQTLEIRPITLLIGKNSSGKSAVAKLFTLLENSLSGRINEPLSLNNDGVELGVEFLDLVYGKVPNTSLKFTLDFETDIWLHERDGFLNDIGLGFDFISVEILKPNDKFYPIIERWENNSISYNGQDKETVYKGKGIKDKYYNVVNAEEIKVTKFNGILPIVEIVQKLDNPHILGRTLSFNYAPIINRLDYIGPFRILPKRVFDLSTPIYSEETGIQGENAYNYLVRSALEKTELIEKVGQWYKDNFDGWELKVSTKKNPYFEILLCKEVNGQDLEINIADTGQGMSQALPLVVRAYTKAEDSIIVLEQPELHLHPAAHADLAELFAWSAKTYEQSFVIETHSENMLLRLRKLVVENDFGFTKDDIIIYWIDAAEHGGQQLNPITIDEEGDLSDFPEGVFNENLKEILEIDKALNRKNKA